MPLKAVVFDVDGTLLDTSEFLYQGFEHALRASSLPSRNRQDIASQIGKKLEECYAFLAPGADYGPLHKLHNDYQTANLQLIKAFEHVDTVLAELKAQGLKLGLWTGRNHQLLESVEQAGLDKNLFGAVVDASMAVRGKPHPDGLLLTLEKLGVKPEEALMVGDAALDIQAGKAATVRATVGITHGFGTREQLSAAAPDYLIDGIDELLKIVDELKAA